MPAPLTRYARGTRGYLCWQDGKLLAFMPGILARMPEDGKRFYSHSSVLVFISSDLVSRAIEKSTPKEEESQSLLA